MAAIAAQMIRAGKVSGSNIEEIQILVWKGKSGFRASPTRRLAGPGACGVRSSGMEEQGASVQDWFSRTGRRSNHDEAEVENFPPSDEEGEGFLA